MMDKCKSCVARVTRSLNNTVAYEVCALYQYPCDMMTRCDYSIVKDFVRCKDCKHRKEYHYEEKVKSHISSMVVSSQNIRCLTKVSAPLVRELKRRSEKMETLINVGICKSCKYYRERQKCEKYAHCTYLLSRTFRCTKLMSETLRCKKYEKRADNG